MKQHNKTEWNKEMYAYLAWRLFDEVYGAAEWYEEEAEKIKKYLAEAGSLLSSFQRKIAENRARRLSSDYRESQLYSLEKMYWHEIHGRGSGYIPSHVDYDDKHYQIWTEAVRKKKTVRLTYDSTTSGVSERLVDPYITQAPYGYAYCHSRKEVRNFRFDRVIDIVLTDKTFKKPKNWKELIKKKAFLDAN